MRVIAGKYKGRKLYSPEDSSVRPTTDKVKEACFSILTNDIYDARVLDLFAGTGGLGIEALSRGASHAYFIDHDPACIQCIRDNLHFTKLEDKATVLKQDAYSALNLIHEKSVDVVFADPPYALPELCDIPNLIFREEDSSLRA